MRRKCRSLILGTLAVVMVFTLMFSMTTLAAPSGGSATGWVQSGGNYYYVDQTGEVHTGWLSTGGKYYYFSPTTGALHTGWLSLGGYYFYFSPLNGSLQTGWVSLGGKYYYFSPTTGTLHIGWLSLGGKYYYFSPANGSLQTGLVEIGGNYFYFSNVDGSLLTGWVQNGGKYYYFDPNTGTIHLGWLELGGKYYYFSPTDGSLLTGWVPIGDKKYYFSPTDGSLQTVETNTDNSGMTILFAGMNVRPNMGQFGSNTGQYELTVQMNGIPITDYLWTNSDNSIITVRKLANGHLMVNVVAQGLSTITITYRGTSYQFVWTSLPPEGGGGNGPANNGLTISTGQMNLKPGTHFSNNQEMIIKWNGQEIIDFTWANSNENYYKVTQLANGHLLAEQKSRGISTLTITYQGTSYDFFLDPGPG